jgi:acyl carrier protein
MPSEDLASALRPKVQGAWNVHRESERLGLDFFVLFSSAAATWGSTGLAHYAAGNHFLDTLAHYRSARGLPALSIDWGRWEGEGSTTEVQHDWLGSIGMEPFTVDEGLAVMDRLLADACTQATVARMDWSRFKPIYEAKARRPLLETVGEDDRETGSAEPRAESGDVLREILRAPEAERPDILVRYLGRQLAAVMGIGSASGIDPHAGFLDLGMDSLMAVQVRNHVEAALGVTVPIPNFMEEGACITTLAEDLLQELPEEAAEAKSASEPEDVLADVDRMSSDEVDSLLEELLRESGEGA